MSVCIRKCCYMLAFFFCNVSVTMSGFPKIFRWWEKTKKNLWRFGQWNCHTNEHQQQNEREAWEARKAGTSPNYLRTYCFSYFIDNVKSHFRKASHPKNMPSGSKKSHRRRALLILLHPLHEEVWDPKSQEQIPGALLFLAMVLAKLDEVIDIRMPRLQIPQHI